MTQETLRSIRRSLAPLLLAALLSTALVQWAEPTIVRAKASPNVRPYSSKPSKEALNWADKELRRMSLDEKIGQLVSVGINATFLNQDSDAFKALRHQIEDNHVGGIILFRGPVYESVILVNRMQALARYPLLISADLEAGSGMRFDDTVNLPWNMAVGATDNPEYARRQGALTAHEARALCRQICAVADVNNNAANPVINVRSYGKHPVAVGRFISVRRRAGNVLLRPKHFPDTVYCIDSYRAAESTLVERLNTI